jgi:hypothetical protein
LFLNNTITDQCNSQNQTICDLCENRSNISSKQINRINNNIQNIQANRNNLIQLFQHLSQNCIYCTFCNCIENLHLSSNCKQFQLYNKSYLDLVSNIKNQKYKLKPDSCCFYCLLPTVICSAIKVGNKCYNIKTINQILNLFWCERTKLNIFETIKLSQSTTKIEFFNKCFNKIYLPAINTEILQKIQ